MCHEIPPLVRAGGDDRLDGAPRFTALVVSVVDPQRETFGEGPFDCPPHGRRGQIGAVRGHHPHAFGERFGSGTGGRAQRVMCFRRDGYRAFLT